MTIVSSETVAADFSNVAAFCPAGVLAFSGDDAQQWLSGQATNDLTPLFEGKVDAVYTLFVTAKGRILADAWVCKDDDGAFLATVPKVTVAPLIEHFDKYIIMEDVDVEERDLRVLSVVAEHVPTTLTENHLHHAARDLGQAAIRILLPPDEQQAAEAALADASIERLSDDAWATAKVVTAEPRFGLDFNDEHYPQEAGLARDAVSFKKGCYIGQEVVCMLENRGKFRRQLAQFQLAAPTEAGTALRAGDEEVGTVTSEATWNGTHYAIAMVTRKALESTDALQVGSQQPTAVTPIGQRS